MAAQRVRRRGEVLGFGTAAALFLPGVAFLGITNGNHFIDNAFFAVVYGVFSTGFAAVPLLAWRRSDGRHSDPGFFRASWLPWLFTTMQGVAYSSNRGDSSFFVLALGWGGFIAAGMTAMYFLGHTLWATTGDPATPSPSAEVGRPDPGISKTQPGV